MKKLALLALSVAVSSTATAYNTGEILTGDQKLSCEAILCLATSTRPSECSPAINRYFSIKMRKPHDTFKARLNFLNICPKDNTGIDKEMLAKIGIDEKEQAQNMSSLTNSIARLPYDCQASTLNRQVEKKCVAYTDNGNCKKWGYRIKPKMPKACTDLANHKWTQIKLPVYRGNYEWKPRRLLSPVWFDNE